MLGSGFRVSLVFTIRFKANQTLSPYFSDLKAGEFSQVQEMRDEGDSWERNPMRAVTASGQLSP